MRWFTSDIHFSHQNILKYCDRPWATIEEMNIGIIERFNALIKPEDEVYCFGDFSLSWQGAEIVKQLNGTWHLFPGNHDKCHSVFHKDKEPKRSNLMKRYRDLGFIVLPENYSLIIKNEGEEVMAQVCHFPFKEDHGDYKNAPRYQNQRPTPTLFTEVLLHGHVHQAWKSNLFWYEEEKRFIPQINLGVDAWDCKPVSERDLFEFCKKEIDMAVELSKMKNEEFLDEGT